MLECMPLSRASCRAGLVGLESIGVDLFSTGIGTAVGLAGGIVVGAPTKGAGTPVGVIGGYIIGAGATYATLNITIDRLNEDRVFPFIHSIFESE